jgi:cytochrome c-type biogenesis protein CcmH
MIWLVFLLITLAAVAALFLMPRQETVTQNPAAEIFKSQLQELTREENDGLIGEGEAKAARIEIERRLAAALRTSAEAPTNMTQARTTQTRRLIIPAALIMLGSSLALYTSLGRPDLAPSPIAQQQPDIPAGVAEMIARLEQDTVKTPDDVEKWRMLAWAKSRVGRFSDSAKAYEKALGLSPEDTEIKTALAEMLTLSEGKQVPARARKLFEEALAADSKNKLANVYLAMADEQAGAFEPALERWRRLASMEGLQPGNRDVIRRHLIALGAKTKQDVTASLALLDRNTQTAQEPDDMARIDGMIAGLAQKLVDNPDNLEGWKMLIRSLQVRQGTQAAREAMSQATKFFKDRADARAELKTLGEELKLE